MKRFIQGEDRSQSTLFPERLDEYIAEDHAVRVIDVFVDELDLGELGFERVVPEETGRPGYHPATLLKLYVYGYLNWVQSSRRLERETQHNVELMWLTARLMPDFKTIADFRKDNGKAMRFPDSPDKLMIFTHGNSKIVTDDRDGKIFSGKVLTPKDLVDLLEEEGFLKKKLPIEIIGCETALGEDSFAEQLGKLLDQKVTGYPHLTTMQDDKVIGLEKNPHKAIPATPITYGGEK